MVINRGMTQPSVHNGFWYLVEREYEEYPLKFETTSQDSFETSYNYIWSYGIYISFFLRIDSFKDCILWAISTASLHLPPPPPTWGRLQFISVTLATPLLFLVLVWFGDLGHCPAGICFLFWGGPWRNNDAFVLGVSWFRFSFRWAGGSPRSWNTGTRGLQITTDVTIWPW